LLCADRQIPKPRYATLADFQAADGSTIDSGLLLYFPNPHSFTGEDVLELQGHGGPVVMQMLLARCLDLGARLAEPGEFSRRAFLNGKMDLAQAEAVADLIDAATASAARSAVRSLQGEFSRAIGELNEELINLRMLVEATLDFPEEDIDFLKAADAFGRLERLQLKLAEIFDRPARASCCRLACMSCWRASPMSASPRCSTAWPATTGHRHADCRHDARRPALDHPDRGYPAAHHRYCRFARDGR
jgi:tRNA U34 5-carboxymethylaminomethyl modifying GTPase MnmE/TrmE